MQKIILLLLLAFSSSCGAHSTGDEDVELPVSLSDVLMGADTFVVKSKDVDPSLTTFGDNLVQVSPSVWELKPQADGQESIETNWSGQEETLEQGCHLGGSQLTNEEKDREFMEAIQLGITESIKKSPETTGDVPKDDYQLQDSMIFKRSDEVEGRGPKEFKFQTLAVRAFSNIRQLFGVSDAEYLESIGEPIEKPLRILGNPGGASSSSFYMTHDGKYIVKTMQTKEAKIFSQILHNYHSHMSENPRGTLLPKFFGSYCYVTPGCGGKHLCFVVMNNLLPTDRRMQQKYDLKGSKLLRHAPKKELVKSLPAYRDMDFLVQHEQGFELEPDTYDALMKAIESDTNLLADFKIMDYSLLLGVHVLESEPSLGDQKRSTTNNWAAIPARNSASQRVLLYVGIIDILQNYRVSKKLEHALKAMIFEKQAISVTSPHYYARRFKNFMATKVFKRGAAGPVNFASDLQQ